jgi:hypothetical protein
MDSILALRANLDWDWVNKASTSTSLLSRPAQIKNLHNPVMGYPK